MIRIDLGETYRAPFFFERPSRPLDAGETAPLIGPDMLQRSGVATNSLKTDDLTELAFAPISIPEDTEGAVLYGNFPGLPGHRAPEEEVDAWYEAVSSVPVTGFHYSRNDMWSSDRNASIDLKVTFETDLPTVEEATQMSMADLLADKNLIHDSDQSNAIFAGGGQDTIFSWAGDDTVKGGTGSDVIFGGAGADLLRGNGGDDIITGGGGADVLHGGGGNDVVTGGAGDDRLFGKAGDDRLVAQTGDDTLTGGDGADTFVLRLTDSQTVTDFNWDEGDRLELSDEWSEILDHEFSLAVIGYEARVFHSHVRYDDDANQLRIVDEGQVLVELNGVEAHQVGDIVNAITGHHSGYGAWPGSDDFL